MEPLNSEIGGEKTQPSKQYLTWFGQQCLHPWGGGFSLNKWGEIHTKGSMASTKVWTKGPEPHSLFFSLFFPLVCCPLNSPSFFLFYSMAHSLHGPIWASFNGPRWAYCIGLSPLFFGRHNSPPVFAYSNLLREVETGLALQRGRLQLPPLIEFKVIRWSLRRAKSTRLNETVGVVVRPLRLNEAVVARRDHRSQMRPLGPRRDHGGQTRPLRPSMAA